VGSCFKTGQGGSSCSGGLVLRLPEGLETDELVYIRDNAHLAELGVER
jgi:hypothetical protein